MAQQFSNARGKELPIQSSISSETILNERWKIKIFSDEGELREFVTSRPILKECLKETV